MLLLYNNEGAAELARRNFWVDEQQVRPELNRHHGNDACDQEEALDIMAASVHPQTCDQWSILMNGCDTWPTTGSLPLYYNDTRKKLENKN